MHGPHDYISPSWYAKAGVPTWNYQAAHLYGVCNMFDEPGKLEKLMGELTEKYESALLNPWVPEYNSSQLSAIVGVEITINDIQCKYKLSQNRSKEDISGVITQLTAHNSKKLAKEMLKNNQD